MSLDNDAHEVLSLLAHIHLEHNRPEKTVILLQTLLALGLANTREQTMLALALLRINKPEIALTRLDELALHGSVEAPYHLVRAQVLHALNRRVEAQVAMQTFLRMRDVAPPTQTAPSFPQSVSDTTRNL